ncbi:MAG: zinc ABC transporter ATP-binding protein [Neisseria elongata]
MQNLFYCKLAGDNARRCLALADVLRNTPDFLFLEYIFSAEADIFCFVFLPVGKSFRFTYDFGWGQFIDSDKNWTKAETAALEEAVNHIAENIFQTDYHENNLTENPTKAKLK